MDPDSHAASSLPEELLKHFSPGIRERYRQYRATRDMAAADDVALAVLKDHVPARKIAGLPAVLTDSSTLQGDMGIDSVSISDAVFVLEDVFDVSISNQELVKLHTVGDLRAFIRAKLAGPGAT